MVPETQQIQVVLLILVVPVYQVIRRSQADQQDQVVLEDQHHHLVLVLRWVRQDLDLLADHLVPWTLCPHSVPEHHLFLVFH